MANTILIGAQWGDEGKGKIIDVLTAKADIVVRSQGGICIKTYFERGYERDRNLPVPSLPLIRDVVLAARETGLPVLLHANSFEAQTFGIDAGVSIFAHGMWNWGALNNEEALSPQIRALLDRIVDRSIGYQSTLQVIGGLQLLFDPAYLDRPDVRRVIPGPLLEHLTKRLNR